MFPQVLLCWQTGPLLLVEKENTAYGCGLCGHRSLGSSKLEGAISTGMLPKILVKTLYNFWLDNSNHGIQKVHFSRKVLFVLSWKFSPFSFYPLENTKAKNILIPFPHSPFKIFKDNYDVILKLYVRDDVPFGLVTAWMNSISWCAPKMCHNWVCDFSWESRKEVLPLP